MTGLVVQVEAEVAKLPASVQASPTVALVWWLASAVEAADPERVAALSKEFRAALADLQR